MKAVVEYSTECSSPVVVHLQNGSVKQAVDYKPVDRRSMGWPYKRQFQ